MDSKKVQLKCNNILILLYKEMLPNKSTTLYIDIPRDTEREREREREKIQMHSTHERC